MTCLLPDLFCGRSISSGAQLELFSRFLGQSSALVLVTPNERLELRTCSLLFPCGLRCIPICTLRQGGGLPLTSAHPYSSQMRNPSTQNFATLSSVLFLSCGSDNNPASIDSGAAEDVALSLSGIGWDAIRTGFVPGTFGLGMARQAARSSSQ